VSYSVPDALDKQGVTKHQAVLERAHERAITHAHDTELLGSQ
jgi:hypothetical protein